MGPACNRTQIKLAFLVKLGLAVTSHDFDVLKLHFRFGLDLKYGVIRIVFEAFVDKVDCKMSFLLLPDMQVSLGNDLHLRL